MVSLNLLTPAKGSVREKRRVARGEGSGWGKNGGRGTKGQQSRNNGSGKPYVGFEGGAKPLYRKLPKLKGFLNFNKIAYAEVNTDVLNREYKAGEIVNLETLKQKKLISKNQRFLKILGNGDILVSLTIEADAISGTAKTKIEKAGGKCKLKQDVAKAVRKSKQKEMVK